MDYFRFHTLGKFPAFGSREDYHVLPDRHILNVLSLMAQQFFENISFYTTIRCYTILVLCNWGWSGKGNGYFATNCFQSRNGVEYDDVTDMNNPTRIPLQNLSYHYRLVYYSLGTGAKYVEKTFN